MSSARPVVDVAVGIVIRPADGWILIGQRPAGKPFEGWWEFPGGKFEPGETPAQATARELDEELGIQVRDSQPWVVREHVYEHAHVRLHFRRVTDWQGEPQSREGQAFAWCPPAAVDVEPLLPASLAPIRWLGLPSVYAISDAGGQGVDAWLARLAHWLQTLRENRRTDSQSGRPLLLLREPSLSGPAFDALFDAVMQAVPGSGVRVLVSSRHPHRHARQAAATGGGIHLTGADLHACLTAADGQRPDYPLVAASCHSAADLQAAGRLEVDLAVCGPVLPTRSHPDAPTLGWAAFEQMIAHTPVPTYALGGCHPADAPRAQAAGAQGIAMQRAIWP